ncbi:MAG TPA: CoA transferase [Chloroflexota bacterium]|nr:CoA transferase [Chloroflexota bacterium]
MARSYAEAAGGGGSMKPGARGSGGGRWASGHAPTRALDGIRVLDLTRVLAGPYCAMMLGDYGADVIKVEQPGRGDDSRHWKPPDAGGESAYYLSINRNKRSIALNLRHPGAQDVMRRLAQSADVLIHNFKRGGMDSMGLGYAALSELNPRLIYCTITGYGEGSPYQDRPGYDFVIQAQSGHMSITGEPDGEPQKVGVAIVDVTTGLYACSAILAALHERESSGLGQHIEVALMDSALSWLINVASSWLMTGEEPLRYGNAHATVVPYQAFKASDRYFVLAVGNDAQFRTVVRLMGATDMAEDERFATNPGRVRNREALMARMIPIFATRRADQWLAMFVEAGIPAGPINTVPQALSDPHVAAREMVLEVPHPTAGSVRMMGMPYKLSRTPAAVQRHPPLLGEHTDEVLRELGLSESEITDLRASGGL